jgi:integrase
MTAHGFRAAASSILNESGLWNPDAIEAQLAHVEGNAVRRAYAGIAGLLASSSFANPGRRRP